MGYSVYYMFRLHDLYFKNTFRIPLRQERINQVITKQAWIGFVVLLLVMLLVVVAMVYWQHVTHVSYLHVLADSADHVAQGC